MKKFSKTWLLPLAIMGVAFLLAGCPNPEDKDVPELTTSGVYKVMDNSAMCECNVYTNAGFHVTERGICWSTDPNPTTGNFKMPNGEGIGTCECCMEDLLPNTTYYVRAYAVNENGTGYGNEMVFTTPPNLTDIDGNVYHTVVIGDQVWMAENLRVTHFRNGDEIYQVGDIGEWSTLSTSAYNIVNASHASAYGPIYNGYAMIDSRNVAPAGWHVPTDADWKILEGTVDSKFKVGDPEWDGTWLRGSDAGGNLKSTTNHWNGANLGATDKYAFTALPGGYRHWDSGQMIDIQGGAYFGTSSLDGELLWTRCIPSTDTKIFRTSNIKRTGGSIRCIKN